MDPSKIKLLDCTLRDGGYTNDWNFGNEHLINIAVKLINSGVDIVETGFLDEKRPFDINRSVFPDTASADKIFGELNKKITMLVAMIDYGTCPLKNIAPAEESCLDGIRVIFKKHLMHDAMGFCAELKKLGYKVFAQLVSVTSYSDDEFRELIALVNEVRPYAVSMVDTYGLMQPPEMLHYYNMLENGVVPETGIGFHAHNNFQMAYANGLAFLGKKDKNKDRVTVIDGTLYGMGKSAGNAPSELLAMTLNGEYGKNYDIGRLLDTIKNNVLPFYEASPWGYNLLFYMAALNRCHPNYLSSLMSRDSITLADLNHMLGGLVGEEKLMYSKKAENALYKNYTENMINDSADLEKLSSLLKERKLLLLGPGKNIELQKKTVDEYIEKNSPVIISTNFIPSEIRSDYVFITNNHRYTAMVPALLRKDNGGIKTVATSNVASAGKSFDFRIAYKSLLEENEEIKDNSFLMLLRLLAECNVTEVTCAGFDGYSASEDNYFNSRMEYDFIKLRARELNEHVQDILEQLSGRLKVNFLTYSYYTEKEDVNNAVF